MVCDSYVRPATLVRICDECNYGSYAGRCVICGGVGISDAYYCKECTVQEKDVRPPALSCCARVVPRAGPLGALPWQARLLLVLFVCLSHATEWVCVFSPVQRDGCPKIINLVRAALPVVLSTCC